MKDSTQHLLDSGHLYISHKREITEVFALTAATQMSSEAGRRGEKRGMRTVMIIGMNQGGGQEIRIRRGTTERSMRVGTGVEIRIQTLGHFTLEIGDVVGVNLSGCMTGADTATET